MTTPSTPSPRPSPPKGRREHLGLFVLAILACVVVVGFLFWPEYRKMSGLVAREDRAREATLLLRTAQLTYHEKTGHYGWVGELAAAGLIDGMDVVEADDSASSWVRTDGYRVEVLLPHARLGPGVVAISPPDAEKDVDADLATRHFAVVARPLEPGTSGFRAWYVDERGELFLNEGVIDDKGALLNRLPPTQVTENARLDTASYLLWQKASEIPPTND